MFAACLKTCLAWSCCLLTGERQDWSLLAAMAFLSFRVGAKFQRSYWTINDLPNWVKFLPLSNSLPRYWYYSASFIDSMPHYPHRFSRPRLCGVRFSWLACIAGLISPSFNHYGVILLRRNKGCEGLSNSYPDPSGAWYLYIAREAVPTENW